LPLTLREPIKAQAALMSLMGIQEMKLDESY
jgi:hypothetical protein